MAEIGILGAHGAVGRAAAAHLKGAGSLRIGGRRFQAVAALAETLGAEAVSADAEDQAAMRRFCDGLELVVSCAGPPRRIGGRVARAAAACGAHYLDASGDDRLLGEVAAHPGRAAILGAGMMPGLSGLLPRALALLAGGASRLEAWVGGCGELTHTAALDYLCSLRDGFGRPNRGIRDGREVPFAGEVEAHPPFFPRPITALPFLSGESRRLAADLGLTELAWHNVFDGTHLRAALGRLSGDDDAAAAALCRAAALDGFGRRPYQLMTFQLGDGERARTLVLRGADASQLSGAALAVAARALLAGEVAPGVRFLAEALDPAVALERLRRLPGLELQLFDGPAQLEEGTV